MSNKKVDPETWLPDENKKDSDCTILALWSKYHNEIKRYRGIKSDDTINSYTTALKTIEASLSGILAVHMDAYDCWDAVTSVRYKSKGKHKGEEYAVSTLQTRLTVLNDIFLYLEARQICINPLWRAPWLLISQGNLWNLAADDIKKAVVQEAFNQKTEERNRFFSCKIEKELIQLVKEELSKPWQETDGRYFALAVYLYCGMRPSEGRALRFDNIRPFADDPSRHYLQISDSADTKGNRRSRMKTKNAPRLIGIHIELETLLRQWTEKIKSGTGRDDLSGLPLFFTKNDPTSPCTTGELNVFVKQVLQRLLSGEEINQMLLFQYAEEIKQNSSEEAKGESPLTTKGFRSNFCTKMYSETTMSDDEIRMCMGHERGENRTRYDYATQEVYKRMINGDHRMIDPSLREDYLTVITGESEVTVANAGIHYLETQPPENGNSLEVEVVMIANECLSSVGLAIMQGLPDGIEVNIECGEIAATEEYKTHRLNTDYAHRQLHDLRSYVLKQ